MVRFGGRVSIGSGSSDGSIRSQMKASFLLSCKGLDSLGVLVDRVLMVW